MVAVTIAAALYYVAEDAQILSNLTEEVRGTFVGEVPSIGPKLESCKYLRACVDEALRMVPPGPGVFWRTSSSDLTIDGVRLPAGTDFGVGVLALHYNEELFPEPLLFRPERFLEAGAREAFIPFLKGFRSCPAQKLAYPTILLPLARLVWEFDLAAIRSSQPGGLQKQPIKQVYEEVLGSSRQPQTSNQHYTAPSKGLYLQTDVFGSRIEGPLLQCLPRERRPDSVMDDST